MLKGESTGFSLAMLAVDPQINTKELIKAYFESEQPMVASKDIHPLPGVVHHGGVPVADVGCCPASTMCLSTWQPGAGLRKCSESGGTV